MVVWNFKTLGTSPKKFTIKTLKLKKFRTIHFDFVFVLSGFSSQTFSHIKQIN